MTSQPKPSALNRQVGGDHYAKLGQYQPWEVLKHWLTPEELRGFMKGTVIAYLAREGDKGGDQDVLKAQHTMEIYNDLVGLCNIPLNKQTASKPTSGHVKVNKANAK